MKPMETLARETTADGEEMILGRRDGVYHLRVDGLTLMSSRAHGSEDALARLGCEPIAHRPAPRVLVAGMGFGYTLRATLDLLPAAGRVVVCELLECVVRWNRGPLAHLAGRPLDDSRVTVVRSDIHHFLDREQRFDAILLDVDNGPEAFTQSANQRLYSRGGLERLRRRLTDGGVLAVWSDAPDRRFERLMGKCGFAGARTEIVTARGGAKGPRNAIFVGMRRGPR